MKISHYNNEPCIIITYPESEGHSVNGIADTSLFHFGNDEWEECEMPDFVREDIVEWFHSYYEEWHTDDDDYKAEDIDNAVACFCTSDEEQYVVILDRF